MMPRRTTVGHRNGYGGTAIGHGMTRRNTAFHRRTTSLPAHSYALPQKKGEGGIALETDRPLVALRCAAVFMPRACRGQKNSRRGSPWSAVAKGITAVLRRGQVQFRCCGPPQPIAIQWPAVANLFRPPIVRKTDLTRGADGVHHHFRNP